jgi:hypothetical protein
MTGSLVVIVVFVTITNPTVSYFRCRKDPNLQTFITISFSNIYIEFIKVIYAQKIVQKEIAC